MGDWNETCMFTNLPIVTGEPCAVILLIGMPYVISASSPVHTHVPAGIIRGKYDGSGNLTNIQNENALWCIPEAIPKLYKLDVYKKSGNRYKPLANQPKNIRELIAALTRQPLFIENLSSNARWLPIETAFIKQGALDIARNLTPQIPCEHWLDGLANVKDSKLNPNDELLKFERTFRIQECVQRIADHIFDQHNHGTAVTIMTYMAINMPESPFRTMADDMLHLTELCIQTRTSYHAPIGRGGQGSVTDAMQSLHLFKTKEIQRLVEPLA